jgi:hypothetical protein
VAAASERRNRRIERAAHDLQRCRGVRHYCAP